MIACRTVHSSVFHMSCRLHRLACQLCIFYALAELMHCMLWSLQYCPQKCVKYWPESVGECLCVESSRLGVGLKVTLKISETHSHW